MEYKRVTLAIIVVAAMIAGSLSTLGNKKILGAQYRRYVSLVQQADRLFSSKNYLEASKNYKQALIIDPRDTKIWARFEQSERKNIMQQIPESIPKAVPQNITPRSEPVMPTSPPAGGMIIEEDEGC